MKTMSIVLETWVIKMKSVPVEIEKYFVREPIKFEISKFEEYMLNDIYEHDEQAKVKLNRDVSKDFGEEIAMYKRQKRNIRYSVKGETRSGKSLTCLKIGDIILSDSDVQEFDDDIEKIVCGNQVEYRQKLGKAEFGEFYLVDENLFNQSGMGANIEASQLKDVNAVIAKMNVSVLYINPEKFLNVGATLGLSTYGRDSKNWLSRCLIYKFKDGFPYLIGYVVLDIGDLFRKYHCFIYKFTGGCTNPNKLKFDEIPKKIVTASTCVDETQKEKFIDDGKQCPFYNMCKHPLCRYELKKDTWIEKEMKGGLDERTHERFKVSVLLIIDLFKEIDFDTGYIKLKAKNGKDLKNRVRIKMPKHTNTKFGIAEYDELLEIIKSNCDLSMLVETLNSLEDEELLQQVFELPQGELISEMFDNLPKTFIKDKKEV